MILNRDNSAVDLCKYGYISRGTLNKLHRNGLRTIGDILDYMKGDESRLLELRSFGKKSLTEIHESFQNVSIDIGDNSINNETFQAKDETDNESLRSIVQSSLSAEISISHLYDSGQISIRSFNALTNAGLNNVDDILSYINGDDNRLLNIRNFGQKSLGEIKNVFKSLDSSIFDNSISDDCKKAINHLYNNITSGNDGVHTFARTLFPYGENLIDAIIYHDYDIKTIYAQLGNDGNLALRRIFASFLNIITRKDYEYVFPRIIKNRLNKITVEINACLDSISYYEDALYFMSENKKECLSMLYVKMCNNLSVRAKKMQVKHFPTYLDAIQFFDKSFYEYKGLCPGQIMAKTLSELYSLIQSFENVYFEIVKSPEEQVERRNIAIIFDFLSDDELEHVFNYKTINNSFPLFYILYCYIKNSSDREWKIFSLYNGFVNGELYKMTEIASMYKLSRERVRQLLSNGFVIDNLFLRNSKDWSNYSGLMNLPYITELSPKFRMIKEDEGLPYDFNIFSRILPIVSNFVLFQIQEKSILVNESLSDNFKEIQTKLDNIVYLKYYRDTTFNINEIIRNVPATQVEDLSYLLKYVLTEVYYYSVSNDGDFVIQQNTIDISQEIYDIIYEKGAPMHIDDIYMEFKKKYPNHKYMSSLSLKPYLFRNESIKPLGNTSTYGIATWGNVYFGGIRDRIKEILEESSTPVNLDGIVSRVLEVIPSTNKKNISSTMAGMLNTKDIKKFKDNLWGLSGKTYNPEYGEEVHERRKRFSFEERLAMFKNFVEEYMHFPFSTGGELEESLYRWRGNISYGIISVTYDQKKQFDEMIQSYKELHYPENSYELECRNLCDDYKEYIETNYDLPTRQDNQNLYDWMKKSLAEYDSYEDSRRFYLTELFKYIKSLGFVL